MPTGTVRGAPRNHIFCSGCENSEATMMRMPFRLLWLLSCQLLYPAITVAYYVSYEEPTVYRIGESVPLIANKITSTATLSAIDYSHIPLCGAIPLDVTPKSAWMRAVTALHGDAFYEDTALTIMAGGDAFCTTFCTMDLTETKTYEDAIRNGFAYNFMLGGLPVAFREEDSETISTQYWGGIPLGHLGGNTDALNPQYNETTSSEVFLYNHFRITVFYEPVDDDAESIRIYRSTMQPFSVDYRDSSSEELSCGLEGQRGEFFVGYEDLEKISPQPASGRKVRFTFETQWIETQKPFHTRWNVFLDLDDAIPSWIEFLSCFLGFVILSFVLGSLYTWVMRDLSYKPIVDESDVSQAEATAQPSNGLPHPLPPIPSHTSRTAAAHSSNELWREIQMWPLSTQVFCPPSGSIHLCILCGIGAQLLSFGLICVTLFRFGLINASQGAQIITPCAIIYTISSLVGGYVTARLYAVLHGDQAVALAAALISAVSYPLLGMAVAAITYDVLPGPDAPNLGAITYSTPLVLLWICTAWPLSVLGGFLGYRAGAINNFPVSSGSQGYQDLNLQDNKKEVEDVVDCWSNFTRQFRLTLSMLFGGILPVFSSFVSYSYAVAAPVFMGTYPDRSYLIASFAFFLLVSASLSALFLYRQIRAKLFGWWWVAFTTSASSGFYIFLLSLCYMVFKSDSRIESNTAITYCLWFGYLSIGIGIMAGFSGIAFCVLFIKMLYATLTRRQA